MNRDAQVWWRRPLVLVGTAVLLVVIVVVVLVATAGDSPTPRAGDDVTPSSSTAASPSAAPSPDPSASVPPSEEELEPEPTDGVPPTLPGTRPPVDLDEPAAVGDGIEASVVRVSRVDGEAQGPGEVSGPAIRVDLSLTNESDAEIDVQGSVVNLSFGRQARPASPVTGDQRNDPFTGQLTAGASAQGSYIFSVPDRSDLPISITFSYAGTAPTALFVGRA